MPTSSDAYAVDTSVAVAAVDAAHAAHVPCRDAVDRLRPALAGHAAVETYSVLTRMPGVMAVDTSVAAEILARVFPTAVWLGSDDAERLRARLAAIGIIGRGRVRRAGGGGGQGQRPPIAHPRPPGALDVGVVGGGPRTRRPVTCPGGRSQPPQRCRKSTPTV